ncbi:MAG: 16S rRNA (uracil(1498)-N(3))-methyltransferase [Oscillospiraceae bacterium]|jgi:16S rRNA (uracil1498-N3)-methyltransferase|nr:16S rRNA (uracil(1498)-N(3))-methyltransferase [Oscillospiraceae bacterium]
MHRFFFQDIHRENDRVQLDEAESRHAISVLRLKKGARIVLLDGLGGVFEAEVEEAGKPLLTARILGALPDHEAHARVTLYQGLPKADKLEWILQKCTELGVHAVQPVQFARSVPETGKGADKRLERLRRIAREATKQSGRGQVPMVGQVRTLPEVLGRIAAHGRVIVPWEEAEGTRLCDVIDATAPAQEIALVIGPEGGITPEEMAQLAEVGGQAVTLGSRILRTETAAIAALAGIFTLTGDM